MAQIIADRRDVDFVLYEQLEADKLCETPSFRDFNRKTFDLILDEARTLALKEIRPTLRESDRQGVRFEDGRVRVPDCFHRPYRLFREGEWTAMTADPELGGQGLPATLAGAALDYLAGANYAFTLYGIVGHSAGQMIEIFGSEDLKKRFLRKMYSGEWGGTMVLTEPEAGSDVGALTTNAVPNPDGTYSITGNKIFITGGEHDLTENIIHPVLARIEGAPAGTKGISLFVVPKIWVNADGSLGAPNDVVCTGVEEKMGIHGSATCSLAFGGKGACRGLLLGEAHKGMRVMFHMMNEARLLVGGIGLYCASAAYLEALNYARERRQGRDLEKAFDPTAPSVPIIRHPDVRRMLLWMKAHVAGMRSLIYYGAHLLDRAESSADEKEQTHCRDLLDLLTPIIKSYCTDRGFEVCSQAIQVYGGYGYTCEYPVEQFFRDVRIASIYEGTNGIQAIDLLARKLGMKNGAVFQHLLGEIHQTVARARKIPRLAPLAESLAQAVETLGATAAAMGRTALSANVRVAFANALPFLDVTGDVIMAWMLLWRAAAAAPQLEKYPGAAGSGEPKLPAGNRQAAFYEGQVQTADYYIRSLLPVTLGRMAAIQGGGAAVVAIPEAAFGG